MHPGVPNYISPHSPFPAVNIKIEPESTRRTCLMTPAAKKRARAATSLIILIPNLIQATIKVQTTMLLLSLLSPLLTSKLSLRIPGGTFLMILV
jgi:hypothetical protein